MADKTVGHPRFYALLEELGTLHSLKNHDYAAGGTPMGNFERVGRTLEQYPNFPYAAPYGVALTYMMKQLDAALWLLSQGHESQTGEGVAERLRDVACYAVLAQVMWEERSTDDGS